MGNVHAADTHDQRMRTRRVSEHLVLDTAGQVATLTLDRPAKHNAISYDMWSSLPGVLDAVRNDDEIRVLVLQGGKQRIEVEVSHRVGGSKTVACHGLY